jgi:TonB family protein
VEVKLDAKGNVADAHVLSGPDELRKAALQSVLQWHFASDSAGATRVVQINFELPKTIPTELNGQSVTVSGSMVPGVVGGVRSGALGGVAGGAVGGVVRGTIGSVGSLPPQPLPGVVSPFGGVQIQREPYYPSGSIKNITIIGLPDQARNELLSRLPVHEGDTFSPEALQKITQAAQEFDEHLSTRMQSGDIGGVTILIAAPGAQLPAPQRIKVGGNVQAVMVVSKVTPVYPELAKSARVSGVVQLAVIINKDGTVQEIHSLGGPALLIQAAMDAVKQWVYRPTLLNGQPVQVETTVDVNFTLNQ